MFYKAKYFVRRDTDHLLLTDFKIADTCIRQLRFSVTSVHTIDEQCTVLNSRISIPRGSITSAPLEKVLSARGSSYGGPDWACSPLCIFRPTGWVLGDFLLTLQKTESRWAPLAAIVQSTCAQSLQDYSKVDIVRTMVRSSCPTEHLPLSSPYRTSTRPRESHTCTQ